MTASNRDFALLCKELRLFGDETLGIDGSFFKADASKGSIYTEDKLQKQLQRLEQKINAYRSNWPARMKPTTRPNWAAWSVTSNWTKK